MSRYNNPDCKVYVGDLSSSASREDLEGAFKYYGPLKNVWVARNPPGFAFVEFEDHLDAEDAVKGLDGRTLCGRRARVELSRMRGRRYFRGGHSRRGRGRPFNPQDRCYECGNRGHYARDCRVYKKSSRRNRSYSRSRSHSDDKKSRSKTCSRSRSRSVSQRKSTHNSRVRSRSNERRTRTRASTESEGNTPVLRNGDKSN